MQNAKRVKVSKSEQNLSGEPDRDRLRERSVLLQESGNRTSGHPLDEHVDRVALLHCAEHSNDVSGSQRKLFQLTGLGF